MANQSREVVIRFRGDADQLARTVDGLTSSFRGLGSVGKQAGDETGAGLSKMRTEFAATGGAIEGTAADLDRFNTLEAQFAQGAAAANGELERGRQATAGLDAAMEKLGNATGRTLQRAIIQTQFEVQLLTDKLKAMGGPGAAGAAQLEAAIKRANGALVDANQKFMAYKDTGERFRITTSLNEAAQTAFGKSLGKTGEVLGGLTHQSQQLMGGLSTLAPLIGGVAGAFAAGYEAGGWFDKKLKEMGVDLADIAIKAIDFARGGGAEFPKTLNEWNLHTNRAMKGQQMLRQAIADTAAEVKKSLPDWKTNAQAQEELQSKIRATTAEFVTIRQKHGDWSAEVRANKDSLVALSDAVEKERGGLSSLEPALQQAIILARGMKGADEQAAEAKKKLQEAQKDFPKTIQENARAWEQEAEASRKATTDVLAGTAQRIQGIRSEGATQREVSQQVAAIFAGEAAALAAAGRAGAASQREISDAMMQAAKAAGYSADQVRIHGEQLAQNAVKARDTSVADHELATAIQEVIDKNAALLTNGDEITTDLMAQVNALEAAELAWKNYGQAAKDAAADQEIAKRQITEMMQNANFGGVMEQLAGGVSQAAQGITAHMQIMQMSIRQACETTIAEVKRTSDALNELAQSNEGMADRAANAVALLTDAWRSGIQSIEGWMQTFSAYRDQLEQMIARNLGSKVAEDLKKVVKALDDLKARVISGQEQQTEHVNL